MMAHCRNCILCIHILLRGETDIEGIEAELEGKNIREEDDVIMGGIGILGVWKEEGRLEGKAEGRVEGKVEGDAVRLVYCIENAMKNLQITLEEACEVLGTTVSRYEQARKLI